MPDLAAFVFFGGLLIQYASLFALVRLEGGKVFVVFKNSATKARFFWRCALLSGGVLMAGYAWHDADFTLCLGQILLSCFFLLLFFRPRKKSNAAGHAGHAAHAALDSGPAFATSSSRNTGLSA